jgi:hypothetical protein
MGEFCRSVSENPLTADRESVLQLISPGTFATMENRMTKAKERLDRFQAIYEATKGRFAAIINRRAAPQLRKAANALNNVIRRCALHNKQTSVAYALPIADKAKKGCTSAKPKDKKKSHKGKAEEKDRRSKKSSGTLKKPSKNGKKGMWKGK